MTIQTTAEHTTGLVDHAVGKPDTAARRIRMREFQSRLVDRMQAARGGSDVRAGQLGVMIGERRWLFDLQQAGEIVAVGPITRVPLTQPWFLGLTNIRGNLTSVVDFAQFRGGAATVLDKECRIIAFAPTLAFNGALLVARVFGLRNTSDMRPFEENPVPPESQQHADADRHENPGSVGPRENAQRFIDADQQIWHVLDLAAVAHDPHYLQVAA